jgi:hypothetical protein
MLNKENITMLNKKNQSSQFGDRNKQSGSDPRDSVTTHDIVDDIPQKAEKDSDPYDKLSAEE